MADEPSKTSKAKTSMKSADSDLSARPYEGGEYEPDVRSIETPPLPGQDAEPGTPEHLGSDRPYEGAAYPAAPK